MANGRRENRPSKNQLLVITFVGAIEFGVERAKVKYNIGMLKSNVKTTSPEKHLLYIMRIESCQWVGKSRTEKKHFKSKVLKNDSQQETPYSSSTPRCPLS